MDTPARILIAPLLLAIMLPGCSGTASGPESVTETSVARADLADRILFLENYVNFRRQYEILDYDIMYQNNGGGMVPAPSDWDIRLIAVVPRTEIEAWVPAGLPNGIANRGPKLGWIASGLLLPIATHQRPSKGATEPSHARESRLPASFENNVSPRHIMMRVVLQPGILA